MTPAQVSKVENEFIHRIVGILKGGSNGESFSALEETEKETSRAGSAVIGNES